MRKLYSFVVMLLVQLITGSVFAQDPPKAQYDAAMATIEDNQVYYIVTEVNGVKWYVDANGTLANSDEFAGIFTVTKTNGGGLFNPGLRISTDAGRFTNPGLVDNKANLGQTYYATTTGDRNDWERQVPFMNEEGKIAIRSCNVEYGTSGWNDAGRTFWTYTIGDEDFLTPCYTYTPAYVWSFELPADNICTINALDNFYADYQDAMFDYGDGEDMNIGTGFGQYADVETWNKLWTLLQDVAAYYELWIESSDYNPEEDPDALTYAQIKEMRAQADSMWQVILDSEVPYMPQDGYYRIFTAERYKSDYDPSGFVNKAIAASFYDENKEKAVYATLDREKANFVWKFTQQGDSILIQNVGMGTYINAPSSLKSNSLVLTEDASEASCVVFDYAGPYEVEYAMDGGVEREDRDVFAIRLARSARGSDYVHQNNHGTAVAGEEPFKYYQTDTGIEQQVSFWARTYNTNRTEDKWTSEWYLEQVPDAEAEELIAAFPDIKEHDLLVASNNKLRADVLDALTTAKDYIPDPLILDASQMTSPYSQNDCGGRDGQDLSSGCLIDGDKTTFWHSAYSGSVPESMVYLDGQNTISGHYIQISDMEDLVDQCQLYFCERAGAGNDRPKEVVLLGANNPDAEDVEWVQMARMSIPNFAAGQESTIPFTVETPYPYVRFLVINCDPSYRGFWHSAELQLIHLRINPNSQFASLGQIAEDLESIYESNVATPDDQLTQEMYDALLDAFRDFMGAMVNPAELRAALAAYKNTTTGVIEGEEPGQWSDTSIADAYDELYAEVEEYDNSGRYNAAQNHQYAVMLKAMNKSVMEKANVVETDKWYHIMFPTEDMFDAYGFSKTGCAETGLTEDQKTMWGTYVAVGKEVVDSVATVNDDDEEVMVGVHHVESFVKDDVREGNRLFFFGEGEIEDEDVAQFRFVEAGSGEADYTALLQDAKDNMVMAIDLSSAYIQGEPLITDAAQLSSNATSQREGTDLGALIDNNPATYWHSDYSKVVLAPHYIQVALNEPISGLIQVYMARRSGATNGHVTRMYVQGSNDEESWSNVGYIELPFVDYNTPATSQPIDLDGTYSYLRFTMTNRYGSDGGGIEYNPFEVITSADDQYSKPGGWSYFHASEFQIYPVAAQLSPSVQTLQQTYTAANKVLLKDATAEDVAAAATAYRAYRTEYNTAAGMDVLPYGKDKADPAYAIQNKATGLFINAAGSNSNDISVKVIPTLFTYTVAGYERSLMHGYSINGDDCSCLHAGTSNRRFCTWAVYTPQSNSGLVLRKAEPIETTPADFTFYKDIKPGKIYGWTNSVVLTPTQTDGAAAYTCVGRYTDINDESFLALKEIETIPAGAPAIYIYGDTLDYDSEADDAEPIQFTIPANSEIALEGTTINGLIGFVVNHTLTPREIYFTGNHPLCIAQYDETITSPQGKTGYYLSGGGVSVDLDITPRVGDDADFDFLIELSSAGDKADGVENIPAAIEKISKPGNVYSMDGKLLMTGATLGQLKTLGRGMYILNGVKVVVK